MSLVVHALTHAWALREVLKDVHLRLDAGRILALVGPSGCGKTTLLHLCAGLLTVQSGRIDNRFERAALMFQQPRLLPWQTVRENIALGLKARGVARRQRLARADAAGASVELDGAALDQYPHQLSGGMQSRAALARALVLAPDLLLMDEPFSALDIGLKAQLHPLLLREQARCQAALLMITHDLMEAVRLADTILVMHGAPGRMAHRVDLHTPQALRHDDWVHHTTAQFLHTPGVRACFGLPAHTTPGGSEAKPVLNVIDLAPARAPARLSC